MTRWVKLSLNFELLVQNRLMKFLLGQRLFNNIFVQLASVVQLDLFRILETTKKLNKKI